MRELAPEFPFSKLCKVLKVPRSSAGYRSSRQMPRDLERIKTLIRHCLVTYRGFGVNRMYQLLKSLLPGTPRAEVRRAYVELGLLKKPRARKPKTTDSRHSYKRYPNLLTDLKAEHPGHVWVSDVTFVKIKDRFAYLALLMDVFTRRIVGWALSWFNDSALTLLALRSALSEEGSPEIHHSDQGSNYAAHNYTKVLQARGTRISMAEPGKPHENGYAERLNRTLKEEEIFLDRYENIDAARNALKAFIDKYNDKRIHSSLGYKTPSEFFRQWCRENA